MTTEDKLASSHEIETKRLLLHPKRSDFVNVDDVLKWSQKRKLSSCTTTRIVDIVIGGSKSKDWRDLRTVKKCHRVPRSLEHYDQTPPRFWELDFTR